MKEEQLYQELKSKMHEVNQVAPQSFGFFTPLYKTVIPYFKFSPWVSVTFLSLLLTFCMYFFFGTALIKIASLLQFGF